MPVAVYKLRIRDAAGDDSQWQEARVVAASLGEALVQAQQRFGDERVMAIAQDATGEPLTDADLATLQDPREAADALAPAAGAAPIELSVPEPRIVHPPSRADAFVASVAATDAKGDDRAPVRGPMPWEGRWRPSVLLRIGAVAGLLLFAAWYQFGPPARDRFVTAGPPGTERSSGLALEGEAPRGGVLAATGLPVRRGNDTVDLGTRVGEAVAETIHEDTGTVHDPGGDTREADAVRTIGTIVGEMFSRWPEENREPDPPPYRVAQPDEPYYEPRGAEPYYEPRAAVRESMPRPGFPARQPSVLRPFFVGVDRGGGIIETLQVTAYDRDHARQIVHDLPERPLIVRGPAPQLSW